MCNLTIGQPVNLTGRIRCKECNQVMAQGGTSAIFCGHDSGFDVFDLVTPLTCPWCSTVNETVEKPCNDPITWEVEQAKEIVENLQCLTGVI